MSAKEDFLREEYFKLWEEFGVSLSTKTKQRSKAASAPVPAAEVDLGSLESIREWIGDCKRCRLCEQRNSIVFGSGNAKAKLLFVGEGPGADEDQQGLPFVGRAGKLLTKMIEAMGYQREEVYIANVVKCRPPQNRTPLPDEIAQCFDFLKAQIAVIKPAYIVALGLPASTTLTGKTTTMGNLRGKFHPLGWDATISVMPTYHPAYLLRNPPAKRFVWEDLKLVKAKLETLH